MPAQPSEPYIGPIGIIVVILLLAGAAFAMNDSGGDSSSPSSPNEFEEDPEPAASPSTPSGSGGSPSSGSGGSDPGILPGGTDGGDGGGEPPEPPSTEPPEPEPAPPLTRQPQKAWTVLFYVAYDNSIGPMDAWEGALDLLMDAGTTDDVNLVALVDQEVDGDSHVAYIQKDAWWEYPPSVVDPSWGDELDTGSPETLETFMVWGAEMFPAERYDVHVMDHGGAWMGFCIDETSDPQTLIDTWEAREAFEGMRDAIGRNIDVVSCDMCFMSCAEFGYELAGSVDYLNGLQSYALGDTGDDGEFIDNWQYDAIYEGLAQDPGMDGREFALHQLANMNMIGPILAPSVGMSHMQTSDCFGVSDLSKAKEFAAAMDALARELHDAVTGAQEKRAEEQLIVDVLGHSETPPDQNTETFAGQSPFLARTPYKMFDVGDFLDRLMDYGDRLCQRETAAAALAAYEEYVAGYVHGENWALGEHPDATGVHIYIPYQGRIGFLDTYGATRWAQDTYWDEFLAEVPWDG